MPAGVGDGGAGVSAGATGVGDGDGFGDGDFFGDAVGDVLDFFFADGLGEAFAFFFFPAPADFFGVAFFFLGEALALGVGDFLGLGDLAGVGELSAAASDFSSDATCADRAPAARRLAISSHEEKRATAHLTKKKSQAGCGAGEESCTARSCSRRRIAFNFPPSSSNRQVRYIQVSRIIMEARA